MSLDAANVVSRLPAAHAVILDDLAFGARYLSFHNLGRFEEQTETADPGLIIWPGGALAEERTDRYGLEYPGMYSDDFNRPDLTEMMQEAISADAALSIILPTARYSGRQDTLISDISSFMSDLLGGSYGLLPKDLILQVGSEYYGHFDGGEESAAQQYATVADIMVKEIAFALGDQSINTVGADLKIAVQMGRTIEDDLQIRTGLSDVVVAQVDMLIHHRFPAEPQAVDKNMEVVELNHDAWKAAIASAGGNGGDLFVSAWNVAQITREDALTEYLSNDHGISREDVDLENRTTTSFEQYWQDRLQDFSYGAEHPRILLETFSSYAEAGMSAGAVYGFDAMHPGRLSWRSPDSEDHVFAGGKMVEMIYESLKGTRALQSTKDFEREDNLIMYGFEGDDRLVIFLAAGDSAPGEVTLEVEGIEDLISLWGDRLEVGFQPNWMEQFDIPDNPDVDESPEAATYAPGFRSSADIQIENGTLSVVLNAFDVVRLVFAKTEDAADELNMISMDEEIDLAPADWQNNDSADEGSPQNMEEDDDPDVESDDGGSFVGGILAALLFPLLFFL